ncbi:MAG TPA: thiamine phosphate synthase [Candidatus Manganitrophaceae bacterium]|nr:thiamine phosphate synthase [Candidatus Manganitrophaceae bacterium]
MPAVDFKLYLIGDRNQTVGRPLPEIIREAGRAGVSAVQFREKDLSPRGQLALASQIATVTKALGMKLLINDRIDLCLALDAEGVHLPSSGFPIGVARRMLGPKKWIGVSCHSREEVQRAEAEGADFAVLGPVYETPSKRRYGAPLGLDYFKKVREATSLPLFAIGGVAQDRLREVFAAGADGVAMISTIVSAREVFQRSRALLEEINRLAGA